MARWLKMDLERTRQDWIIAYFHHPPYTKGTHDSDKDSDSAGRMNDMRQTFLPVLEQGGVDLILTGLQSDDQGHGQFGPVLAEKLGMPHSTIIMEVQIADGRLRGDRIRFRAGSTEYEGQVSGSAMKGAGWTATRQ